MMAELRRALRFQRAMIAPLPYHERIGFDALYLAADVISADFYDVALLGPDHARLFVADATGHGIAAALATMFVKAEYETQKRSCETSSELIGSLNDVLTSRYETLDLRCTAVCVDIYPERGFMAFTTAAHPGPAVIRPSGAEFLAGGNTFMGLQTSATFRSSEIALEPGDLVIAFTDGLLDASNAAGEPFGRERLSAIARRGQQAPSQFGSFVVNELSSFVGEGRTLLDDVTILGAWLKARAV
jgi:serine phosphatase RsbU (regulator of sigma subunit)